MINIHIVVGRLHRDVAKLSPGDPDLFSVIYCGVSHDMAVEAQESAGLEFEETALFNQPHITLARWPRQEAALKTQYAEDAKFAASRAEQKALAEKQKAAEAEAYAEVVKELVAAKLGQNRQAASAAA